MRRKLLRFITALVLISNILYNFTIVMNASTVTSTGVENEEEDGVVEIEDDVLIEEENKKLEELRKRNFKNETETEVSELPKIIMDEIKKQEEKYPGIKIGVGLYSLDGSKGFEYNANEEISGGCTIKLSYSLYSLLECEKDDIDIDTSKLTFNKYYLLNGKWKSMRNTGSGKIKYDKYGTKYTLDYLFSKLLGISDNTAYNILTTKFSFDGFAEFLKSINGQELKNSKGKVLQYGKATVVQRKNEWLAAYNYMTSGSKYSDRLRKYLSNTFACYIYEGMRNRDEHTFMHKSGWSSGDYYCACDVAIVDENYLLVVMTQNSKTHLANSGAVRRIGRATQKYAQKLGNDGKIF